MTEAAQEETSPPRQLDRVLLAEAKLYGVDYASYVEMTPRERGSWKGRWAHKLRSEAKRRGIDPDEFIAMSEDAREEARKEYPYRKQAPPPEPKRSIDDVAREHVDEEELAPAYSEQSSIPPTEADPRFRDKPTLGSVQPSDNADLVGWNQPANLLDVYARYAIGDGEHFIRVERLEPKVWHSIPCSGYIGVIRDPISEDDFIGQFGGRQYLLTVYGPDMKGRRDPSTGLPIIKAKTAPFKFTVPRNDPSFQALPNSNGGRPVQGFPGGFQGPATPADAQMFRSTLDFFGEMTKRADEKVERALSQNPAGQTSDVLRVVSDAGKTAIEQANQAAQAREEGLRRELESEREHRRELEKKIADNPRSSSMADTTELLKVVAPTQSAQQQVEKLEHSHNQELNRIREQHKELIDALKASNKEAIDTLKSRQEEEGKRMKERFEDIERGYKTRIDELERRMRDRETEHRADIEAVRKQEREAVDRRVQETEKHLSGRMEDLKTQHASELRIKDEHHTTRSESQKSNWDYQISNYKERIKRLEDELEEAQAEAASAKDPAAIIEKAKKDAEALGFEKKEDLGPQTAGERFAATVGLGISKAFETINDWGPKMVQGMRAGPPLGGPPGMPQPARLPQGQQGLPQQRRPAQSRRTVAWATENSIPITGRQPSIPPSPTEPVAAPPPAPAAEAGAAPPATATPESAAAQPPPAEAPPQQAPLPATNPMGQVFPDAAVVEFRAHVEAAINAGFPAETFAQQFRTAYPEAANALVAIYKAEDVARVVKSMPNSADSPILRGDGKRWVDKLWQALRAGVPGPQATT
jgi:septal ring factor EnvC (AmiA/AmiB activator)